MTKYFNLSLLSLAVIFFGEQGLANHINARKESIITLDGTSTRVYFNDGDTFKALEGFYKDSRFRIEGFNTLETYGPHQWLNSSRQDLERVASQATKMAQRGGWHCTILDDIDTYGRLLARCDDLALELIGSGLGHAYSVNEQAADAKYLKKQKRAQKEGLGMWAGGIPAYIITSLHSASEGGAHNYNRLISTEDGHTRKMAHEQDYATCENVCIEQGTSCMLYVPYTERYGRNRPECLYKNAH